MFVKSVLGKSYWCPPDIKTPGQVIEFISHKENLPVLSEGWRLEQNGKFLKDHDQPFTSAGTVTILPAGGLLGGKGGFGSLLRAIGAQIEKTTNHEAMRDLSGRRQRDVNNEKRVRDYVAKQAEREREEQEKKEVKLEKLRRFVEGENVDKHSFSDPLYDKARSETEEKVHEAVEAAMKTVTRKAETDADKTDLKRKGEKSKTEEPVKRKKWMDEGLEDLSGSDVTDSEDEEDTKGSVAAVVPV